MRYDFHTAQRALALVVSLLCYSMSGEPARAEQPIVVALSKTTKMEASNPPTGAVEFRQMPGSPAPVIAIAPNAGASDLWALTVTNANTHQTATVRLYDEHGKVDEAAAAELDNLLGDTRNPTKVRTKVIDRRTLQLIFRAAYHFRSREVEVISGYRKGRSEGRHGEGRAIDFRLPKVSASALASYLRKLPRVGVGLYTHPSTHFVHLDVRERSYHWLDASPPGVSWPLRSLGGAELASRDASYRPEDDLPEAMQPAAARTAELGADMHPRSENRMLVAGAAR